MCSSLRWPLFNTRVGLIRRENKSHPLFLVHDHTWHCTSMAAWGDCAYLVINVKKIATAEREDKKIPEKRSLTLIQHICMNVGAVSLGNSPKRYPSVLKKTEMKLTRWHRAQLFVGFIKYLSSLKKNELLNTRKYKAKWFRTQFRPTGFHHRCSGIDQTFYIYYLLHSYSCKTRLTGISKSNWSPTSN